jgi:anti-sigma factor RsiW
MSLTEDKLEILIGKYLDGQATPIEQHLMEKEMNQNPRAKEMCEHWGALNAWGRELVVDKIVGQGAGPEEIFEQAWRRSRGMFWLRLARSRRHMRFAVGVAAGFLLGVVLHYTLVWTNGATGGTDSPRIVARDSSVQPGGGQKVLSPEVLAASQSESRNVNSYTFVDSAGNRYWLQGVQEKKVRPAAYYGL